MNNKKGIIHLLPLLIIGGTIVGIGLWWTYIGKGTHPVVNPAEIVIKNEEKVKPENTPWPDLPPPEVISGENLSYYEYTHSSEIEIPILAPEFQGISEWLFTDQEFTMEGLRGKVVVVNIGRVHCSYCMDLLPELNTINEQYPDEEVVVLMIHSSFLESEMLPNVVNNILYSKVNFPVGVDDERKMMTAYDTRFWPFTVIVDKQGYIRYKLVGVDQPELEEFKVVLSELVETGDVAQRYCRGILEFECDEGYTCNEPDPSTSSSGAVGRCIKTTN